MLRDLSAYSPVSLVYRSHPLMRRNSLVNQVEFLGLVNNFVTVSPSNIQSILCQTVSPSNIQSILCQTHSKRYGYSSRDKKFYCCKGSATSISQSHWPLSHLENKLDFVHQSVSPWEAHTGFGTRLGTCLHTHWIKLCMFHVR